MAALMFGIDICETDMQISLWNEERTCAETYQHSGTADNDVIPLFVLATEEGRFLAGKEAIEYSLKEKKNGITSLYGRGVKEIVELNGKQWTTEELFAGFIGEILSGIRKRYGGAPVARIGVTGERLDTREQERLLRIFNALGYPADKIYFISHADAFLWYEMNETTEKQDKPVMALDYDSEGMLSYILHPAGEAEGSPFYLEKTDFSEMMPSGLENIRDMQEKINCFSSMTELALNRRNVSRLYVTGKSVESEEMTQVLGALSSKERRIFCGRSLYSLGACYHAVKEKFQKPVISDGQIFHNVYLEAYQNALSGLVPMALAGTLRKKAKSTVQVILDDTTELVFQIEDVRTGASMSCTIQPESLRVRENRTIRLEVSAYFLDDVTLVIKLRDIGFGDIYPATFRVWEQIISLT